MKLGELLENYRVQKRMGIRELAKEIGLSQATLWRIEQSKPMDQKNLMKVLNWLFTDNPSS